MTPMHRQPPNSTARARGVTLIELMVALVLGLIVSGAALTLFVTNKQTYTASESLGRIQEGQRTAFELMSRDVREAAGNACEKGLKVGNIINNPTSTWYTDFSGGIRGYDGGAAFGDAPFGTAAEQRVAGTDAVELKSSVSSGISILNQPGGPSADIKVNTVASGFQAGDIVMACNFDHAAIFQIDDVNGGGVNIVHNTGNTVSPGNCSKGLGYPTICSAPGTYYDFGSNPPGVLAKLRATRWYVGYNARIYDGLASKSLYQSTVQNSGSILTVVNNEVTEGVRDVQLKYLLTGATAYVDASAVSPADWASDRVVAVDILLTMEGRERVGTDKAVLQRGFEHIVTLRNRAL